MLLLPLTGRFTLKVTNFKRQPNIILQKYHHRDVFPMSLVWKFRGPFRFCVNEISIVNWHCAGVWSCHPPNPHSPNRHTHTHTHTHRHTLTVLQFYTRFTNEDVPKICGDFIRFWSLLATNLSPKYSTHTHTHTRTHTGFHVLR